MIFLIRHLNQDLEESQLIESLLKWQRLNYTYVNPSNPLMKKYYKGNGPVVLFFPKLYIEPLVFYGFFPFVTYMSECGMLLV